MTGVQTCALPICRSDFEASIERKINFLVPYDVKAAANAAKLGQTFAEANRSTKAGAAMRDIAAAVIGAGAETADEVEATVLSGKKSLLGKFDLKAMLPPKKK